MANPPDLLSLPQGARVQDPLLVHQVETRQSESGPFTILTLGNRSGTIATAPFWLSDQPKVAGVNAGDVVQVIGEVASYRDRRQLSVSSIRVLPQESVDWLVLMPSAGNTEPLWDTIDRWLRGMESGRLRNAVEAFFLDDDFRNRFGQCPATVSGPQAMLGGLVKHTVEVAAVARTLGRVVGSDPGLTMAGALLHDIGKLEAYHWKSGFRMTRAGQLIGPAVLGTAMLSDRLCPRSAPILSAGELRELQHIQLVADDDGYVKASSLSASAVELADEACTKGTAVALVLEDEGAVKLFGTSHGED